MLNHAEFQGRLVTDPELRRTASDLAVCSFAIAVDRGYVKQGEERQADFIDCVAWRQAAEFLCKHFAKGRLLIVEGRMQTRTYTDNAGAKRKATELVVERMHFCEPKRRDENAVPAAGGGEGEDFIEISDNEKLPF